MVANPSGKGTGVAEVVKGELTSEAYCWPFPGPGLPHYRCLPDPTESQGTPGLKITCWHQVPIWERRHRSPCPGSWATQKPVGSQPEETLQDWPAPDVTWLPPPGPLPPGTHCAMLLPHHQALSTLQPWDPLPRLPSKAGAPEVVSWGWGRLGALGVGKGPFPPLLCCPLPPLLLWLRGGAWQMSQKQFLLGVGAEASPWGKLHCEGAKKLPGQAWVTPSVPVIECVSSSPRCLSMCLSVRM